MNIKPISLAQEKLEELLTVYQPHDADSLTTIFSMCWTLGVEPRLIDLSQLDDETLQECKNKICNEYTFDDCKFVGEELQTRYNNERERNTPLEVLYGWNY